MKSAKKFIFSLITGLLLVFICSFIYAEELQVKRNRQITDERGYNNCSWSPDGKRIVYVSQTYQPVCNVVVMNSDGGRKQYLTKGRTGGKESSFSP